MSHKYLIVVLIISTLSCSNNGSQKLVIAASANTQFAMLELEKAYELKSGKRVDVILGSSGKLTAQIIAGAPYDIFLSADDKYPERLNKEGLSSSKPRTYALGKLVIWTSLDSTFIHSDNIKTEDFKVALANPKIAPYGMAAQQFLKSTGDWMAIQNSLVFGENISQVNQFLLSGAVQVGFTSKSSMYSDAFKNKGIWKDLPYEDYEPIKQTMVILNNRPLMQKEAQAFYDFILSDQGQEILKKYGYDSID